MKNNGKRLVTKKPALGWSLSVVCLNNRNERQLELVIIIIIQIVHIPYHKDMVTISRKNIPCLRSIVKLDYPPNLFLTLISF